MLRPAVAIHSLSKTEVTKLLTVASEVGYDILKAEKNEDLKALGESMAAAATPGLQGSAEGYFVRLSHCSPKDADGGNLRAVFSIREALVKLVSSKRTVQALLGLYYKYENSDDVADNQLYFFPYHTNLDRLSEWRCYVNKHRVVAISQSRFYQCNHAGITDEGLQSLAEQVRALWSRMAADLDFDSCVLDIYAKVLEPQFSVKLIEINPWGAYSGSGSLLFHWLDDAGFLEPTTPTGETVIRIVEEGESPILSRDEAYKIGRDGIIENELRCLKERGLEWVLQDEADAKFMALPLPAAHSGLTTRKDGLEMFRRLKNGGKTDARLPARDHPRFVKLKKAYRDEVLRGEA
ncbi:hypothetical protein CkaCkLH20_11502 [Colletotrichum karsti]|uniref:Cell division cycle protein 123 n=1 Tax=Colletotrichum karsti TaxID=1095194 RepID=A0A9P6HVV9_9PEZI|nr:uncharacterized protein CkaCkLH20_11502 [Colletotrichum karsti]KAF9871085.1 hypothetical protein CkaCkLH20_11502 [Colletotrichum karsti]